MLELKQLIQKVLDSGIKFIAVDGYVTSYNDQDNHFVDAKKVRELYQLNYIQCQTKQWHYRGNDNEIVLHPRNDGDYNLYNRIKEFYNKKDLINNEVQKETNNS